MAAASARYLFPLTKMLGMVVIFQNVRSAPNPPRASVLVPDWSQHNYMAPEGQGTYAFGYDVEDPETNNVQFRSETRYANGSVTGSYGYLEPDGNIHMVHYIADENGYRAKVEDSARIGMLKPIPVLHENSHIVYGYTPQMLAAIKSQLLYKGQKVHEQHQRPFDQLSEEEKLSFADAFSKKPDARKAYNENQSRAFRALPAPAQKQPSTQPSQVLL